MITIDLLKNHMEQVPLLATIWHEVLGKPWALNVAPKEVQSWMNWWQNEELLPLGFIAFSNDRAVGGCGLQLSDGIRSDLYPWLTDLCVDSSFQGRGIGRRLVEATKAKAFALQFKNLYLFTFDKKLPPYYEKLGFKIMGYDRYRNLPITVMIHEF